MAYYRTGYESTAYTSNDVWAIRLLIERSRAIKCPSIQYQLAGTKKVQEALAQPGVLKQFLDESEITKVLQIFTGLYALELVNSIMFLFIFCFRIMIINIFFLFGVVTLFYS